MKSSKHTYYISCFPVALCSLILNLLDLIPFCNQCIIYVRYYLRRISVSLLIVCNCHRTQSPLHISQCRRRFNFYSKALCLAIASSYSSQCTISGYGSEMSDRDRSHSYDSQAFSKGHRRCSFRRCKWVNMKHAVLLLSSPLYRNAALVFLFFQCCRLKIFYFTCPLVG